MELFYYPLLQYSSTPSLQYSNGERSELSSSTTPTLQYSNREQSELFYPSGPKGFKTSISCGSRMRSPIRATSIANPVNRPK